MLCISSGFCCGPGATIPPPTKRPEHALYRMASVQIHPLDYHSDSSLLALRLRGLPGLVWLDSARPYSGRGHFDLLAAAPQQEFVYSDKNYKSYSYETLLKYFKDIADALADFGKPPANPALPAAAGAMGYCSYELGALLHQLPLRTGADDTALLPLAHWGIYAWAVINDHQRQQACLVCHPACPPAEQKDLLQRLHQPLPPAPEPFALRSPISSNMTRASYLNAFDRIQAYIAAGDCYQINLAQCFQADYSGDPFSAYLHLRGLAAAPFSALLQLGDASILSFSPERFIRADNRQITTSPIKGTAPRHADPLLDQQAGIDLQASSKNRAENLMIVDLLRNDLGKSCQPGSIRVERLFELQSFATVHHLVSTVRGQLHSNKHPLDVLLDCFPGGSITGAPKRRAMQIIAELEPDPRQIYCGSIGYLGFDGKMDTNIPIRTLLCRQQRLSCWSGGGIVADSEGMEEYRESELKVAKLLAGLG